VEIFRKNKAGVITATDFENTNKPLALVLTLAFHGIIVAFLFLIIFHTPIPPYPEVGGGGGLQVNFGNSQDGMGDNLTEQYLDVNTQDISKVQNKTDDQNILTDQNGENVSIADHKKPDNKVQNKTVIKINDPVVNPKALYKGSKSGNEGETGKPGNQGNPNGDPNVKNHYGIPGGTGNGNGGGDGDGNGPGKGPGNSKQEYSIKGRTVVTSIPPRIDKNFKKEGKVVVTIKVDKSGNVIWAEPGARGTTTSDPTLFRCAKEASLKWKFDSKNDAAEEQIGTITFNFIIRD